MQQSSNKMSLNRKPRIINTPTSKKNNISMHDSTLGNSQKLNQDRLKNLKPLKPLNKLQSTYLSYLENVDSDSKVIIATGWPGCVDKDTEYLSPYGWKKISDYSENDEDINARFVGQVDENGLVSFMIPDRYVKAKCDYFYHFKSSLKDQMLSIDHKVAYRDSEQDTEVKKITVEELLKTSDFKGLFNNSIQLIDYYKTSLPERDIRLSTLLNLYSTLHENKYVMVFDKDCFDKIKYLESLLMTDKPVDFTLDFTSTQVFYKIDYTPIPLVELSGYDKDVAIKVIDILRIWSPDSASFLTKTDLDADSLQFIINTIGFSATVKDKVVKFSVKKQLRILEKDEEPIKVESKDGFKYCFEVPTGLLVLRRNGCIFVTGNSSKTYLPTAYACQEFLRDRVGQIVFSRPAISNSKSLGFFSGDKNEKMEVWLAPVLSVVKEQLGTNITEIAIKREQIVFYPLEVIKGLSLKGENPNQQVYYIVDEAEDLTQEEIVKIVTRIGKHCTLVLAGDITQSELKENSGLKWLIEHIQKHQIKNFFHVDFNDPNHIVRSNLVRDFIISMSKKANK